MLVDGLTGMSAAVRMGPQPHEEAAWVSDYKHIAANKQICFKTDLLYKRGLARRFYGLLRTTK